MVMDGLVKIYTMESPLLGRITVYNVKTAGSNLVFQNVEDSKSFSRNFKARDILITTNDSEFLLNKELENDNTSQWVDVNTTTSYLKIDILSSYPGIEVSGSNPFDECAIQEITFYGRG